MSDFSQSKQEQMPGPENSRSFLNRAMLFMLAENIAKPLEPLLVLICAGIYAGGTWGVFKFYESLIFLFFRLSAFGLDKGVIWYFSQVDEKQYLKNIFRSLNFCFMVSAGLGAFTWLSLSGVLPFGSWITGGGEGEFTVSTFTLLIFLSCVPMMVVSEILVQANINKQNLKYRVWVNSIVRPLFTYGLAVTGYWLFPDVLSLPVCFFIGNVAGVSVALVGFLRVHRPGFSHFSINPVPSIVIMKYSLPLASANIFSALALRVDIFMIAGISGVKSLEVYNVVSMIGKTMTSIRQSFDNILLSVFSSSSLDHVSDRLKHYFNYAVWMVMNIQAVVFFFAAMFGRDLLPLIHEQYAAGYSTLLVVAFFITINTFADFSTILTLGIGRTMYVPLIQVVFFAVNLGLNFYLIPLWDATGAALALGLGNFIAGILYFLVVRRTAKDGIFLGPYWMATFTTVLVLGIFLTLQALFPAGLPMQILYFLVGSGLVFWIQKAKYKAFNLTMKEI